MHNRHAAILPVAGVCNHERRFCHVALQARLWRNGAAVDESVGWGAVGRGVVLVFDGVCGGCHAEDALGGGDFFAGDGGGGVGEGVGAGSAVRVEMAMVQVENLGRFFGLAC